MNIGALCVYPTSTLEGLLEWEEYVKILLSIKPEFANKILKGIKKYEYRKRIFRGGDVTSVVVYSTKPVGKIVGEFEIESIIRDTPYNVWQQTKLFAGIKYSFIVITFEAKTMPLQ